MDSLCINEGHFIINVEKSVEHFSLAGREGGSDLFRWLLAHEQPLIQAQLEVQIPGDFCSRNNFPSLGCCRNQSSVWCSEAFDAPFPGVIIPSPTLLNSGICFARPFWVQTCNHFSVSFAPKALLQDQKVYWKEIFILEKLLKIK